MAELLLAEPQPPLSHFGATLLRHVLVTALRYSLYHLGLPLPDRAPIRISKLRLDLDTALLARPLRRAPRGEAVLGALLDPAGVHDAATRLPTGAVFFHRQRLRWARRRPLPQARVAADSSVAALEVHFRGELARLQPRLNEALLDEIITSLNRRRRRLRKAVVKPCLGPAAAAWRQGQQAAATALGAPDPFAPSWAELAPALDLSLVSDVAVVDGGRARFRESYRQLLDRLRPTLRALGRAALERGVIDHRDDLFFLPCELLGDLTADEQPRWLPAAVLRNRAEYFGLVNAAEATTVASWAVAPLRPLA